MALGGTVTDDAARGFASLIRQIEAGKLRFPRSGAHDPRGPNHWEMIDT
jgi:hypothetical protein